MTYEGQRTEESNLNQKFISQPLVINNVIGCARVRSRIKLISTRNNFALIRLEKAEYQVRIKEVYRFLIYLQDRSDHGKPLQ